MILCTCIIILFEESFPTGMAFPTDRSHTREWLEHHQKWSLWQRVQPTKAVDRHTFFLQKRCWAPGGSITVARPKAVSLGRPAFAVSCASATTVLPSRTEPRVVSSIPWLFRPILLRLEWEKKKNWNRMTASVLKQDSNTKRFKRTLIYFNTYTKYANLARKRHLNNR